MALVGRGRESRFGVVAGVLGVSWTRYRYRNVNEPASQGTELGVEPVLAVESRRRKGEERFRGLVGHGPIIVDQASFAAASQNIRCSSLSLLRASATCGCVSSGNTAITNTAAARVNAAYTHSSTDLPSGG